MAFLFHGVTISGCIPCGHISIEAVARLPMAAAENWVPVKTAGTRENQKEESDDCDRKEASPARAYR